MVTMEKTEVQKQQIGNPIGTRGFEFVEFTTKNLSELTVTLKRLGFNEFAKVKDKEVYIYAQGHVRLVLNGENDSYAGKYAGKHGHSMVAQGYRVEDSKKAFEAAVARGAKPYDESIDGPRGVGDLALPVIHGIDDTLIYFADENDSKSYYGLDLEFNPDYKNRDDAGLLYIDHLDHNVNEGNLETYKSFYMDIFNFREVRYWELEGEQTGINSSAFMSPCDNILIPIIQSSKGNSYVQEYLDLYQGEGIQHIAFYTRDICSTIETLRSHGQKFLEPNEGYYDEAKDRLPPEFKDLERVKKNSILIDGDGDKFMLQIFTTKDELNPIFFEFIERGGYLGFGERNFPSLFDALEKDQFDRGYLNKN